MGGVEKPLGFHLYPSLTEDRSCYLGAADLFIYSSIYLFAIPSTMEANLFIFY